MENPHIEEVLEGGKLKAMLSNGESDLFPSAPGVKGLLIKLFVDDANHYFLKIGRFILNSNNTYESQFNENLWFADRPLTIPMSNSELAMYDNTGEFGLAFFPRSQVETLLKYPGSPNLLITRGSSSFSHLVETDVHGSDTNYIMKSYRTLIARPFDDPVPPVSLFSALDGPVSEDQALALIIAPPCPPIWREMDLIMAIAQNESDQGNPIKWNPPYKMPATKKLGLAFGEFFKSIGNSLFGKKDVKRR